MAAGIATINAPEFAFMLKPGKIIGQIGIELFDFPDRLEKGW